MLTFAICLLLATPLAVSALDLGWDRFGRWEARKWRRKR